MARPVSDEELQLKKRARRRLVGAIVLVSAVAVILPMVLDSEPKALNQKVDIQIPTNERADKAKPAAAAPTTEAVTPQASAETGSVPATAVSEVAPSQTQREPVHSGSNAAVNGYPAHSSAPAEPSDASASTPAASRTPKPEASESKPAVAEGAKTAKPPQDEAKADPKAHASAGPAYVVQVAALTDSARAKQLQRQMSGVGIKAYTEVVATKSGDITRVRAGPYTSREAAEKARTQLKKAGVEGKVVPR